MATSSNVTVDIRADTTVVVRKLRAIAEHCTALADELTAIDVEAAGASPTDQPDAVIPGQ